MKNIKLFVFDVGNTLIHTKSGYRLSALLLRDLYALREKGYLLGLSTLRSEKMLEPILLQFSFDFLIMMNGGLVKADGRVLFSNPFSQSMIDSIYLQASERSLKVIPYEQNGSIYAIELPHAAGIFLPTADYQSYIWAYSGNIDLTPHGVTKIKGLSVICTYYNLGFQNVVAFGDGYNDVEMLATVGYSVAMGGAPNEVIRVCNYATETAEKDGISVALRKMEVL